MERVMREKLLAIQEEYDRLSKEMSTPEVASDHEAYRRLAQKQRLHNDLVECFQTYLREEQHLSEAEAILREEKDPEMREFAQEEREARTTSLHDLEQKLRVLLIPKDPNDAKNTIVEIRAGTGGDEAALFVADLFRMYSRFAEQKGWKIEVFNSNETGIGGYKEISFKIAGDNVYSQMKYEGGTHRVQRVPDTETQGRIHTSAATVAVLPEAEEVDFELDMNDVEFDVYRSSGPGGQSVNTTDSAVRVTHKPTGMVVMCQDEKSQHKNKARAIQVLRSRLLAKKIEEEAAQRSAERKSQVGTGDRSGRIRTYNFPQSRVTDHRINLTQHNLWAVMEGDLQDIVDALSADDRAKHLEN